MQNRLKKNEEIGWAKMSKLLDKEMPQKEKKRRIFFWYFSAAAIVPILGMALWYLSPSEIHNTAYAKIENKAQINNNSVTSASTIGTNHNQVTPIYNINDKNANESLVNKHNISTQVAKSILSEFTLISDDEALTNSENKLSTVLAQSFSTDNQIELAQVNILPTASNTKQTGDGPESKSEPIHIGYIASIHPVPKSKNEIYEAIDIPFAQNAMHQPISQHKFSLDLGAGMRMMLPIDKAMPLAGLSVSYQISDKWSINSGIYYCITTQSSDSLMVAANYYNEYSSQVDKFAPAIGINAAYSYIQDITLVDHKIIHVPLKVGYSISNNFTLSAGIYYDKMISQKTNYILLDVNSNGPASINAERFLATNSILSHNFNWTSSVTYNYNKRLSLSLDILGNKKFIPVSKDSKVASPFMQVTAKYRFTRF